MVGGKALGVETPVLTLRTVEKLSYACSVAYPKMIDPNFDLLETTRQDNELLDSFAQIFNCDESGLPLGIPHHLL